MVARARVAFAAFVWLLGVAMLSLTSSCDLGDQRITSPQAVAVVHAVMNPDSDEQVILVESSLTGVSGINNKLKYNTLDPIRTAGGSPITGADVRLYGGTDTVGARASETIVSGRGTGRYTVARTLLSIDPGRTYRLRVRTTDGITVTGTTTVPTAGSGWFRGAGSSSIASSLFRATDTLMLDWQKTVGATTYAIRVETPDGPWFLFSDSTRFTLPGHLRNFFAEAFPSVWYPGFVQPLSVVASDRNYYDYNRTSNDPFGGAGLISSVDGGIGLFGSVLPILRRDVSVTDRDVEPIDSRWSGTSAVGRFDVDLWLEDSNSRIASLSGRARSFPFSFIIGTQQGTTVKFAMLGSLSRADTVSVFTGRIAGDSLFGSYSSRFSASFPTVYRRTARVP